ncbi:MAG: conjugative transposon protein TraJ [Bacteroidales bacterium]|jgi:conjugative transposon TraJ protein|nr:conjugative transposon protein TraJ [Bacteroidales bacterium]
MLLAVEFDNLHQILRNLYGEMMPLCSSMAGVARGIAGLGALFHVSYRIWQSLARAEPVDVYPLLRPFALGLCIMFFPTIVLGSINGIMSPVVKGTNGLLADQTMDMHTYQQQKDKLEYEAMMRDPTTAFLVSDGEFDRQIDELGWSPGDMMTIAGMYVERGMYNLRKWIRNMFRELLELIFQAASLLIDTVRTFFLTVLAILGPIAFAISVWDGFQATLTQWICRYISVYLWLPVADLFSAVLAKIQVLILQNDIERLQTDPSFSIDASNGTFIVFMIIGIIGYFTVPTVANWIIQAGGMGNYGRNINNAAIRGGSVAAGAAGATSGNVAGRLIRTVKAPKYQPPGPGH